MIKTKNIFTLIALGAFITLLTTIPSISYATVTGGFVGPVGFGLSYDYSGFSSTLNGHFIKMYPPIGVVGNNNFNDENLRAFDEGQNLNFGNSFSVDILASTNAPGLLPPGTYASHYVMYDPVNSGIEGCVDFDSDVVAVITTTNRLAATDVFQDTDTTGAIYQNPGLRGLESNQDDVVIADPNTICLAFRASSPGDFIRVLTDFSPLAVDNDKDGFTAEFDCDDNDPNTYPGATEISDGKDNNCDGQVDEGLNTAPVADDSSVSTDEDTPYDGIVSATDTENDSLTYLIADEPTNGTLDFSSDGTYTYTPNENYNGADSFTFIANDGEFDSNIATVSIDVIPVNDAPVCSDATSSIDTIWPPTHKMISFGFAMETTDVDGDTPTLSITSIFQDEPTKGLGDGDKSPDADIQNAQVRAERSGLGDGRVYVVTVTADDGNGGSCQGTFSIGVPHDKKDSPVDSGTKYNSTQ